MRPALARRVDMADTLETRPVIEPRADIGRGDAVETDLRSVFIEASPLRLDVIETGLLRSLRMLVGDSRPKLFVAAVGDGD